MKQRDTSFEGVCVVPTQDDWLKGEPKLREMLNDPIVRMVMRRDNLGPADVWAAVEQARTGLTGRHAASREVA
jgi:hypothetical protein